MDYCLPSLGAAVVVSEKGKKDASNFVYTNLETVIVY